MTDLTPLLERLEAATEGRPDLGNLIALALGWTLDLNAGHWWAPDPDSKPAAPMVLASKPSPWTTSLDAALTLVPEGWDLTLAAATGPGRSDWSATLALREEVPKPPYKFHRGRAATPALALCIAALKARND